jgi:dienelactone hydrolase
MKSFEIVVHPFLTNSLRIICAMSLPATATGSETQSDVRVPVDDGAGHRTEIHVRLCGFDDTPRGVVVVNHGSPPNAATRPMMAPGSCGSEATSWFMHHGYAVALPLRTGYGDSGGMFTEGIGDCSRDDYVGAGLATAREIDGVVDYLAARKDVDAARIVVLGVSAGGWGTMAYDSTSHPHVAAFVNFAGGRGGHHHNTPNDNCRPDNLVAAAGRYGQSASAPMLWIYSENDSFFGPALAQRMYEAFAAAGGQATFEHLPPYGSDGHALYSAPLGSVVWGPLVERYLASRGVLSAAKSP